PEMAPETLLEVRDLSLTFPTGLKALDGVSLSVMPGETLGIVGESGSGKTTMGRCLLRVYDPQSGVMNFRRADGSIIDLRMAGGGTLRAARRDIRMIFQDPVGSLNPRKTVADIIGEPLRLARLARGKELDERVAALMQQVGL